MKLKFAKMSGAGNDFVLIEKRGAAGKGAGLAALAKRLCDRRGGIGADGLLVLSRAGRTPRLDYFNADGSSAFCGNGSRCAARWMHERGWTGKSRRFSFLTSAGTLRAEVLASGRVSIAMPRPRALQLGLRLRVFGRPLTVHAVNTGVPHAVVEVKNIEEVDVRLIGKALRSHRAFGPAGVNVDFVLNARSGLMVRTYERGVEDETLACGTGAVASALVAAALRRLRPPVRVRVRSGDALTVSFETRRHALPREVWLEGPARITFTGEASL